MSEAGVSPQPGAWGRSPSFAYQTSDFFLFILPATVFFLGVLHLDRLLDRPRPVIIVATRVTAPRSTSALALSSRTRTGTIVRETAHVLSILLPVSTSVFFNASVLPQRDLGKTLTLRIAWEQVILLFILYTVGCLLSALSNVVIERVVINHGLGYPYELLFRFVVYTLEFSPNLDITEKIGTTRQIFVSLLTPAVLGLVLLLSQRWTLLFSLSISTGLFVGLVWCTQLCAKRKWWGARTLGIGITFAMGVHAYALKVIYILVFRASTATSPFSLEFRERFNKKFNDKYGLDIGQAGTDTFWLPYIYVHRQGGHITDWVRRFEVRYVFARNLAAAFFLLVLMGLSEWGGPGVATFVLICGVALFLSFSRFLFIYVNYFTKAIFRSFYEEGTRLKVMPVTGEV